MPRLRYLLPVDRPSANERTHLGYVLRSVLSERQWEGRLY